MTNEELDQARADEAWNLIKRTENQDVAAIAARLAREGWTPPEVVDPDLAEAEKIRGAWEDDILEEVIDVALAGIKRGRELERAEADIEIDQLQQTIMRLTEPKPTPYSVPDGYEIKPHTPFFTLPSGYERKGEMVISGVVQHYANINPPEDK